MNVYRGMDQDTLDREYSPSSCVDDINVYLDDYLNASHRAGRLATEDGSCIRDLAYGTSSDERLDLFLPRQPRNATLNIYIHGGYWQALSKRDSLFAAPMFQAAGSYFAAIDYTLAPRATLPEIVEQVRQSIVWLFRNAHQWGIDRDKIYLSGSSAGAHLAAMMLTTDWREYGVPENIIKGVCAVSGIYDLQPVRLSYVNEPLKLTEPEAAANSPLVLNVTCPCPVVLAYGDNETGEFKRQTNDYRELLSSLGTQVLFAEISSRNHFDVIMDLMHPDTWLSRQVLQQMGLS